MVHFRGVDITPADEEVSAARQPADGDDGLVDVGRATSRASSGRTVLPIPSSRPSRPRRSATSPAPRATRSRRCRTCRAWRARPSTGACSPCGARRLGDTRVYADGVYIPTLYHFGGLRSTVNAALVELARRSCPAATTSSTGAASAASSRSRRARRAPTASTASRSSTSSTPRGSSKAASASASPSAPPFASACSSSSCRYFLAERTRFEPKYWDYQLKLHLQSPPRATIIDLFFFGSDDELQVGLTDVNGGPFPRVRSAHLVPPRPVPLDSTASPAAPRSRHAVGRATTCPTASATTVGNGTYSNTDGQLGWALRAIYHLPLSRSLRLTAGLDYEGTRYNLDARQNPTGLYPRGRHRRLPRLHRRRITNEAVLIDHTDRLSPTTWRRSWRSPSRCSTSGSSIMPQFRLEAMTFVGTQERELQVGRDPARAAPGVRGSRCRRRVSLQASIGVYHQAPGSADLSRVFGNRRARARDSASTTSPASRSKRRRPCTSRRRASTRTCAT